MPDVLDTPRFRRLNQFPTGVLPLVEQASSTIEQRQAETEQSSQRCQRPRRHNGFLRSIRLRLDALDPLLQNLNADSRLSCNFAQECRLLAVALDEYDAVFRMGERQHQARHAGARPEIDNGLSVSPDERKKLQRIRDMSLPQRFEALLTDEGNLALPALEEFRVELETDL
jgi:hypothetical protein